MNIVIQAENISKKYIINHQNERYLTLRDSLTRKFKELFRKPMVNLNKEDFWALKNISFSIEEGDRVGVIGRNGAGKSTLLKVLSKITEPTEGKIKIIGRVASLLEVGTGFHPELTGRENIFLNGAILGMSRAEIKKKFDEIVSFSEVEKFLDTPVKRYSSGMYVRLAFSVAAHLDPEILVVDEVLAVGDFYFRQKCLGKMSELQNTGRTVIFVSHDMNAVKNLCNKAIWLDKGCVKQQGPTEEILGNYVKDLINLDSENQNPIICKSIRNESNINVRVVEASLIDMEGNFRNRFSANEKFNILLKIEEGSSKRQFGAQWHLYNSLNQKIAVSDSGFMNGITYESSQEHIKCEFDPQSLIPGTYHFQFMLHAGTVYKEIFDNWEYAISFEIVEHDIFKTGFEYPFKWSVQQYVYSKWI